MDVKQHRGQLEVKNAAKGEVSAVFSTLNAIDSDNDVTLRGFFADGQEVRISAYNHTSWGGPLPVGKGSIRISDTEAILDGQFFMGTTAGRETFEVVKEMGSLQEWSYGFDVLPGASRDGEFNGRAVRFLEALPDGSAGGVVHEVSPVLLGAGVNTRTLATKGATGTQQRGTTVEYKRAIRPHETETSTKSWDGVAADAEITEGATVTDLRSVYAWVDSAGDPEQKANYKFPHHHGAGGPANLRACLAGIATLNGATGAVGIPDEDRKGVYEHLASHLRDADREPPELRSTTGGSMKLQDELFATMAVVTSQLASVDRVVALRAQKGKTLSGVNVEALEWVDEDLQKLRKHLRSLIDSTEDDAAREYLRFVQLSQGVTTS